MYYKYNKYFLSAAPCVYISSNSSATRVCAGILGKSVRAGARSSLKQDGKHKLSFREIIKHELRLRYR